MTCFYLVSKSCSVPWYHPVPLCHSCYAPPPPQPRDVCDCVRPDACRTKHLPCRPAQGLQGMRDGLRRVRRLLLVSKCALPADPLSPPPPPSSPLPRPPLRIHPGPFLQLTRAPA